MNLTAFIAELNKDPGLFQPVVGIQQEDFEHIFTEFQKCSDRTRKLGDREKLYAIMICKRWGLSPEQVGLYVLDSVPLKAARDGKTFLANLNPRLDAAQQVLREELQRLLQSVVRNPKSINDLADIITSVRVQQANVVKIEGGDGSGGVVKNEHEPAFVINTTAYVPSDTETDTNDSSDEEKDESFSESDFTDPPFYIQRDKRGVLEDELFIENSSDISEEYTSKVMQPLLDQIEEEGFADSEDNGSETAHKRLSLTVGLNRPRSLSTRKNRVLTDEVCVFLRSGVGKVAEAGYPMLRCGVPNRGVSDDHI